MASRKARAGGGEAARGARTGAVDLSTHPLVSKLQADPANVEPAREVATLVGYVGPSKRDGYVRLYQDLTFQNYYEIPSEAVTATNPVNPDDENSPTAVQVEPDAKVEVVTVASQSVEARFLSGAIASGFYATATAGAGAAAGVAAAAAQPLLCALTRVPTVCGPICPAYFTARPTNCGPACNPWGFPTRPPCIITRYPTFCIPNPCGIVATHFPSCDVQVTVNVTIPGPFAAEAGAQQFAAMSPAAGQPLGTQPVCIAHHTLNPSLCSPCQPIAHTGATLCTQVVVTGTCITIHTHYPSWCPPPPTPPPTCVPIANTAARLCTLIVEPPPPPPPPPVTCLPVANTASPLCTIAAPPTEVVCRTAITVVPSACG